MLQKIFETYIIVPYDPYRRKRFQHSKANTLTSKNNICNQIKVFFNTQKVAPKIV